MGILPLYPQYSTGFAHEQVCQFIVPDSCPNIDVISLAFFPVLTVETTPEATDSTQLFSVEGAVSTVNSSVVYISGQNLPVTVPISNTTPEGGKIYFFAPSPYDAGFARGLTIGVLVSGANATFNSTLVVAAATLHGPVPIEVD
jgi:hypothetical protein